MPMRRAFIAKPKPDTRSKSLAASTKSFIGVLSPRFSRPDGLSKCRGHRHLRISSILSRHPGHDGASCTSGDGTSPWLECARSFN